ncbi:hypothetical protein [Halorubrum tibetense]|uniref:Lipoprotein n=1 Tax=Halorubrum tibetense TaxID=175631 RepID=A0ABD5SC34_9EURY
MDSGMTRRELLSGATAVGVAAGLSGCLDRSVTTSRGSPDDGSPSTMRMDGRYPLVSSENVGGRAVPTMPVNVRIGFGETDADVEAVRDVFRYNPRWSPIVRLVDRYWPFHESPTQFVWDADLAGFRRPLASYRYPFLRRKPGGAIGYHVYLWDVRDRGEVVGVVGQAHKDVGSLRTHVGTDYHEATGAVATAFHRADWHTTPASFDYGVDPSQRRRWGPTGDLLVRPE